jgi:hypothetical protein
LPCKIIINIDPSPTENIQSIRRSVFKVSSFGTLTKETTTNALHKEDRQYIRIVSFEYMGSAKFGNEYLEEVLGEMKAGMPNGYTAEKEGFDWNFERGQTPVEPFYIINVFPISLISLFLIFSLFGFCFD